jgi:multiple sugar transport system substrate-binding protein
MTGHYLSINLFLEEDMKSRTGLLCLALTVFALGNVWAGARNDQSGAITLRFAWWGGDARAQIYNEICDRFEADNPGIKITREPTSFNDYFTKLSTQVAGGGAADILQMHARYIKQYAENGVILSLDDLVAKKTIDLSNFSKASIDMGVVGGKNLMIAIGVVTTGVFVNDNVLNELGIPRSRLDNLDWAGLEALCIEIAQKSGGKYYAISDHSFVPDDTPFTMFMRSRGKDFFTPDGKIGFAKEDLTAWLNLFDRLRKAGAIPAAQIAGEQQAVTWEQSTFVADRNTAFTFLSANRLRIYQDQMPGTPLSIIRAPSYQGKPGEYLEGAFLTINSKSKNAEAAAKFINYFVNTERSLELYKIENGFPGSTVMNKYVYTLLDSSNQKASQFMDMVTSTGSLPDYVLPPENWQDILRLLGNESQAVAYGRKTVDQAVNDFFVAIGRL